MTNLTTLENVKNYIGANTGVQIAKITLANPCVITAYSHGFLSGVKVMISGVNGTTQLNSNTYIVSVIDADNFSIGIDSTLFTPYISDGFASSDDILITRLISSASDFIMSWLNRNFDIENFIEVRDGTGTGRIMVKNYPIISVSSVTINGTIVPLSDGTCVGYRFDENKVWLVGGVFPKGYGNVQITYEAGYQSVPYAIEQGCIELVASKYFLKDRIGVSSKSINGESTFFSKSDMRDDFKSLLANYTRVMPIL